MSTEEMEFASFEDLTSRSVVDHTEIVTLSGGKKVMVRGLSRYELTKSSKDSPSTEVYEQRIISTCMVKPQLSAAQVAAWQQRDVAGGDLSAVTAVIQRLSGLDEGAEKSNSE